MFDLYYKIFKADELAEIRKKLKKQASDIVRQHTDDALMLKYLPERIDTLPPNEVFALGDMLDAYNTLKGSNLGEPKLLSELFYTRLSLTYSLNGWFRNKIVSELKE